MVKISADSAAGQVRRSRLNQGWYYKLNSYRGRGVLFCPVNCSLWPIDAYGSCASALPSRKNHKAGGKRFRIAAAAGGGRIVFFCWSLLVDVFLLALAS